MDRLEDLLFESDISGRVLRVRGLELPKRLVHVVADVPMTDRAPGIDTTWVLRGAYAFARRARGGEKTDAAKAKQ